MSSSSESSSGSEQEEPEENHQIAGDIVEQVDVDQESEEEVSSEEEQQENNRQAQQHMQEQEQYEVKDQSSEEESSEEDELEEENGIINVNSNGTGIEQDTNLEDPIFTLIQREQEQEEMASIEQLVHQDTEEVENQQEQVAEEEQEENPKKKIKRSAELLYMDPEDQEENSVFLVNRANRSWKRPAITKVDQSGALSRVKDFLPQLHAANDELEQQIISGKDFNIENLASEEEYIEMSLALGVLEEPNNEGEELSSNKPLIELI